MAKASTALDLLRKQLQAEADHAGEGVREYPTPGTPAHVANQSRQFAFLDAIKMLDRIAENV